MKKWNWIKEKICSFDNQRPSWSTNVFSFCRFSINNFYLKHFHERLFSWSLQNMFVTYHMFSVWGSRKLNGLNFDADLLIFRKRMELIPEIFRQQKLKETVEKSNNLSILAVCKFTFLTTERSKMPSICLTMTSFEITSLSLLTGYLSLMKNFRFVHPVFLDLLKVVSVLK